MATGRAYLWSSYANIRLADPYHFFHGHDAEPLFLDRRLDWRSVVDNFAESRGETQGMVLEISTNVMPPFRPFLFVCQKHVGH